jgi:hypothetical protein
MANLSMIHPLRVGGALLFEQLSYRNRTLGHQVGLPAAAGDLLKAKDANNAEETCAEMIRKHANEWER